MLLFCLARGDVGKLLLPHIVDPGVKCPVLLCLAVERWGAVPFPAGFTSGIVIPCILGK